MSRQLGCVPSSEESTHRLCHLNRSLPKQNCAQIEKELLVNLFDMGKLHKYVFVVTVVDHKPLEAQKKPAAALENHTIESSFAAPMIWCKNCLYERQGEGMFLADPLSRPTVNTAQENGCSTVLDQKVIHVLEKENPLAATCYVSCKS